MYQVILYYQFSPIEDLQQFWFEQKLRCLALELKGRVYVVHEGINGTLCGLTENIERYKKFLHAYPGFENTEFKEEPCDFIPFNQLKVKIRPEMVTLKSDLPVDPNAQGGNYLEPSEWRRALESDEDFILLDVRNNYESAIGHFDGAIQPPLENFYDFPQWMKEANLNPRKKVLMYCTGGIRCEKFSAFMKQKGFQNVYQLRGGIINYAQKEDGAHFKGKCFVFDDRLAVPVNPKALEPIGRCEISNVPCDTYINCSNPECNRLFLCSRDAAIQMQGACSDACKNNPDRRPFNVDNIYAPYRKWYHYVESKERKKSYEYRA